jgi:hypothetical protein
VQILLEKIYLKLNKNFDSFDNLTKLSDAAYKAAIKLSPSIASKYLNTNDDDRLNFFYHRAKQDILIIKALMKDLIDISIEAQSSWRNQAASYASILFLLNSCEKDSSILSLDCVKLYLDSLIHDNIKVRKVSRRCYYRISGDESGY